MKLYVGISCLMVTCSFGWAPPRFLLVPFKNHQQSISYIFAHGLGASQTQASKLFNPGSQHSIFQGPLGIFDFPDAKAQDNEFSAKHVNLGQAKDIERCAYACNQAHARTNQCQGLVLVGISRGAATILNYSATNTNAPIKAIVAEAPFDMLETIVEHLMQRFKVSWLPFSTKVGMTIAKKRFETLDIHGLFPIKIIHQIPKHIPVLLVHSRKDNVIPISSSYRLYSTLRNAGHSHVYLLELPVGAHGKLMLSTQATMYRNVVHAFYKKYMLPHNVLCAQQGEALFAQCQPGIAEIQRRLAKL